MDRTVTKIFLRKQKSVYGNIINAKPKTLRGKHRNDYGDDETTKISMKSRQ